MDVINIGPSLSTSRDWERERRRRISEILMGGGNRTGHASDGALNAVNKMVGAWMLKEDESKQLARQAADRQALADAVKGFSAPHWTNPDTKQVSQAPAGGYEGMMAALGNHPDADVTRTMLPQILFGKITRDQAVADRKQKNQDEMDLFAWKQDNTVDPAVRQYEYAKDNGFQGTFADWKTKVGGTQDPSSVQEWNFFNKLPPAQQAAYLTMKRANPWVNRGDAMVLTDPANPGATMAEMPKGIAPERQIRDGQVVTMPAVPGGTPQGSQMAQPVGAQGAAPGVPQAQGPSQGVTAVALPQTPDQIAKTMEGIAATDRMIRSIDELIGAPGREFATGFSSIFNMVPGTPGATFKAKLETLKSQAFLPMVQQLKGMGQLSNAEGEKLTAAIGALDPGMEEDAFLASLNQIKTDLQAAKARNLAGLSGQGVPPRVPGQPEVRAAGMPTQAPSGGAFSDGTDPSMLSIEELKRRAGGG